MTSIKARLNRSRLGKDGLYPLVIQVIYNRVKREIYTPYRLKPADFDARAECAVATCRSKAHLTAVREVNDYLIYMKDELRNAEQSLVQRGEYTCADIIECYKSRNDQGNFFAYADHKIDELDQAGRHGTAANYRSAISAFARFVGKRCIASDDITRHTVEDFVRHSRLRGNHPNTIVFYLKQLCAIYNKADDEGLIHNSCQPFQRVRIKGTKPPKRAISARETGRIAALDLSQGHPHKALARDLFFFSLYTRGMAFVDMCYLRKENISGQMIVYRRRKTGQLLQVKIEPDVRTLLRKYADPSSPYLLPMLRTDDSYHGYRYIQRRLNKRIREIGDLLEFDFPLTFYVARHTWATTAHRQGVPLSVISEGMGHTSERTTRIYLANLNHAVIDKANRMVIRKIQDGGQADKVLNYLLGREKEETEKPEDIEE